jgi:hypothetical protein
MAYPTKLRFSGLLVVAVLTSCKSGPSDSTEKEDQPVQDTGPSEPSYSEVISTKDDASKNAKIIVPEGADLSTVSIEEGAQIANDVTASYLNIPPGVESAGPSVFWSHEGELGALIINSLTMQIPLEGIVDVSPESLKKIVVFYHIETETGKFEYGIIPYGSLTIEGFDGTGLTTTLTVSFQLVGKGSYQPGLSESLIESAITVPTATAVQSLSAINSATNSGVIATAKPVLPANAVMAFDAETCPDGWERFYQADGRIILGAGSGNQDADGALLTKRILGSTGGREYTSGLPASSNLGGTNIPSPTVQFAQASGGENIYNPCDDFTTLSGEKQDSNMSPYLVLTYCKRTNASELVLTNAVTPSAIKCPSNSAALTKAAGRGLLGSGNGNLDVDGVALTPRTHGDTGGREFTTGIPAVSVDGGFSSPNDLLCPAKAGGGESIYSSSAPNTTLSGPKAESNMPPFEVLNICKFSKEETIKIPPGMVVAFDQEKCPSGWIARVASQGRMIIGAGSGNLDADNNQLSVREMAAQGGREVTTGIPAHNDDGDSSRPGPTKSIARAGGGEQTYNDLEPNTSMIGLRADANLPPYIVLNWCEKE